MKLGFTFNSYNDVAYILHTLNNTAKIVRAESDAFTLQYKDDEYYFSSPRSENFNAQLIACDRKIKLCHNTYTWKPNEIPEQFDKVLLSTPGEPLQYWIDELDCYKVLDTDRFMIHSGCYIPDFYHRNYLYNPWKNFYYFYNLYGFKFLNFYNNHRHKHNLLGLYHRWENGHALPGTDTRYKRNRLVNKINDRYPNILHRYGSNESTLDVILNPYTNFGQWEQTHSTTYTDYSTSVCNLIWESRMAPGRYYFSEKTLKGILFSAEKLFFMWWGPEFLYRKLKNKGLWFLNFEFIDYYNTFDLEDDWSIHTHTYSESIIEKSIFTTIDYLVELKETYKTNQKVYEHLLEKYGDKLEKNYNIFKEMLVTCEENEETRLINFLKQ